MKNSLKITELHFEGKNLRIPFPMENYLKNTCLGLLNSKLENSDTHKNRIHL